MKVKIWKVSQINSYIRNIIDGDILMNSFFSEGEISNLKNHSSGHIYFTLKDEKASINCVMFKTYAESISFNLETGMKVIVCGYVSVFEKTGQIQLYAEMIESVGRGRLYAAFEQLKTKLQSEGLFDERNKKVLPAFPKCVAVITSGTGAAVHDIINVIRRRNKSVKIVISPVLVQGESAPAEIVSAIKQINAWGKADVIILGRGGGSIEDLWAFNDESVARGIYASKTPVISAVGHETDFTIADFVSDLRAPTPSAAAELAVGELELITGYYLELSKSMEHALREKVNHLTQRLNYLLDRKVLKEPGELVNMKRRTVVTLYKSLDKEIRYKLEKNKLVISGGVKSLENISPLNVISRGYALATDNDDNVVTSIKNINVNDIMNFRFRDGIVITTVKKKRSGT